MENLKTVDIRGKEYVEVKTRVIAFNAHYINGRITSEFVYDGNYVRCKATVVPDLENPERYFTGHAEEDRTQGNINKTNATENCETSAVGRALAMMGIGIVESVASADEVQHAMHKQQTQPSAPQQATGHGNCKDCGSAMVPGKSGKPYCVACYKKWKTQQEAAKAAPLPVKADEFVPPDIDEIPL